MGCPDRRVLRRKMVLSFSFFFMYFPSFKIEREFRKTGLTCVVGTDEAGSGAWAGPVFAGAVWFGTNFPRLSPLIRDSKLLSPTQREEAFLWIKDRAKAWAIGQASVDEITSLNIRQAGLLAMQRAIKGLGLIPDLVLSDGFPLSANAPWKSQGIVKGDRLVASIAAASIVAKVSRDHHMQELDEAFPGYGFAIHKGYGTFIHAKALQSLGPSRVHRVSYAPIAKLLAITKL